MGSVSWATLYIVKTPNTVPLGGKQNATVFGGPVLGVLQYNGKNGGKNGGTVTVYIHL